MQYVRRASDPYFNAAPADAKSWSGIDQMNVNERNHQVGFMDQIYSNARSVRICIQDSSLTASLRDYNRLFSWLRCRRPENYAGIQTSLCSDLRHLLSLRYFRRVWVIQEVALAQEVCLHVNNNALLLDSAVMDRMESFRKQNRLRIPSALKWSTCRTIEAGIVACLQAAMECNATDPRDEVYAVLSLMEPQARSLIPVDYSLDLDVVWSNAIAAIIITRGNLDILSHVGVYQHRSVLSTRVRRSSMNRVDIAGYLEKVAFSNSHHLTLPYSKGHRATPWRRQLVMPSNHSDISQQSATFSIIGPPVNLNSMLPRFRVRAHYVDRIDVPMVVGVSLKKRKRGKDYGDAVYYDWDQKPLDRIRSYSVRSLVAFFKADVDNVSTTDPHKPSHGTSGFHPGTVTSESERREALILNDPGIEDTDLSEFIRICQISRKGRPLFTSHFSVGFPGISSEEWTIRRGDEIFAIDGARTPFILRKSEHIADHYEIIDECYLWAALELDCWNPGTRKGRWGPGVERPTTTQTRMINIC